MKFNLLKKSAKRFYPAIRLERTFIFKNRGLIRKFCLAIIILAILSYIGFLPFVSESSALGFLFIALAVWVAVVVLHLFYLSVSLQDMSDISSFGVSFGVAGILFKTNKKDVTLGLINSKIGKEIMSRLGLSSEEIKHFVENRNAPLSGQDLDLVDVDYVRTFDYVKSVYVHDKEFQDFLSKRGISSEDLEGATSWVSRVLVIGRILRRWWAKENLGKIKSIGRDWSYGKAFTFEKYSLEISGSPATNLPVDRFYYQSKVEELEAILSREEEANAILVGEEGVGVMDVIAHLQDKIHSHDVSAPLQGKHVRFLDTNALIAQNGDKQSLESELIIVFRQIIKAGNIILVVDDLPAFISSAKAVGSDVIDILDQYLNSNFIQFIATSSSQPFHSVIESDKVLMDRFETIWIEEGNQGAVIGALCNRALIIESQSGVFFTYPAIKAAVVGSERYFAEGSLIDNAVDLLVEIVPRILNTQRSVITKSDIMHLIEIKTKIPTGGVVSQTEREKLLNLESRMHQRIIGQKHAVASISDSLRRSRSGVTNPKRPIGSFLFLGPTGVGKTETTKTLAEVFFGDEKNMIRLDMSEYNGPDAINKLIGSFESGKIGVLTSIIREHPYSVLLLDEFEKTHDDVLDLFLQILDEGMFSDMHGNKVNARNLIIIATSNAGSDLIWKMIGRGEELDEEQIVEHIVHEKIFKPELLNRFDRIIAFHPLNQEQLKQIAKIKLSILEKRMKTRGIIIRAQDDLIELLAQKGHDPKFGARALNRAIQDTVEKIIADKIINQNIKRGDTLILSAKDVS